MNEAYPASGSRGCSAADLLAEAEVYVRAYKCGCNPPATTADASRLLKRIREAVDGDRAQLQRIAEAHGYNKTWRNPSDPSQWFAERLSADGQGIEIVTLDDLCRP